MKIVINGETLSISGGGGLPEGTVAIKPLTKAEYDALTDDEKNADVVYAITDDSGGGSSGGGSSEEVYSTEETRIGTWIDGKPLYRRVLVLNITTNGRGNITLADVSDWHIDTMIDASGSYRQNDQNSGILDRPISLYEYIVGLDAAKTTLLAYVNITYNATLYHVVLEYTKTTDEAAS